MNFKRKALLIGNSNGLEGVKVDLANFKSFLMSNKGGAWNDDEIVVLAHATLLTLDATIRSIKSDNVDYCIVYFSGHGAYQRATDSRWGETILELEDGNTIHESLFNGLSKRQLTIIDSCRNIMEHIILDSIQLSTESVDFSENERQRFRMKYNHRIMEAIPQHSKLYSCSIGESSNDTVQGGIYTQALLNAIKYNAETVGEVHTIAKDLIDRNWNNHKEDKQHPEAILPKCLTSQQLIFCINSL